MEKKQSEVVLYGTWSSAFCLRVELALKLKRIPYEYVEEDLTNKSQSLLHYNPVHKKVPVLVHKRKPIAESLVILEYIDDCWNHFPKLLPQDPHQRAKVRFWANFHDQKMLPILTAVAYSKEKEEQEKAIKELNELLTVFEEGIERDFSKEFCSNGKTLGFLDIVFGAHGCNFRAFEEAVTAVIDPEKHPLTISWIAALKDCPLIKETLPLHEEMVARLREVLYQAPKV